MSTGGFDWDDDYEDLVKERKLRVLPPEGIAEQADKPVSGTMSRFLLPAVLCAALVGAYAVLGPQLSGSRAGLQTAGLLPMLPTSAPVMPMPALQVYSDMQSRSFLNGLARFSDAELLVYAETTRRDLTRAGTMLAPYMRDALALAEHELTRRAVPVAPAYGQLESVRIDQKLRG